MVKRLDVFRKQRKMKKKYILVIIISIILTFTGLISVDHSLNSIMNDSDNFKFISIKSVGDSYIVFKIMDKKYYLNTVYVKRDFHTIKSKIKSILPKI